MSAQEIQLVDLEDKIDCKGAGEVHGGEEGEQQIKLQQ